MNDLATFAIEHGTSLVALVTGITAMVRARARKDTAAAAAVELLSAEHAKCTAALEALTARVDGVEEKAAAAEEKAAKNAALAEQLNAELVRLMREIQQ